jgi:hypothetical protein
VCDQSKLLDAALSFVALIEITVKKGRVERERERKSEEEKNLSCVLVCL